MYQPAYHREDDLAKQHALILARPLGLLITEWSGRSHSQSGPVWGGGGEGGERRGEEGREGGERREREKGERKFGSIPLFPS